MENFKISKRTKDLTGQKFGKLTVISFAGYKNGANWLCKCDCGNYVTVIGKNMRYGKTTSCGCIRTEMLLKKFTKHGDGSLKNTTRLYKIWKNMRSRCYNSNNPNFKYYGGRGIKICEEWYGSYSCFRDWSLSNGYSENLTIDRIDVNGNYEPSNCRWATRKEQSLNTRSNRYIEYNGETKTLSEWSKIFGLYHKTIAYRLNHGWSVEKALTTPTR